MNPEIKEPTIKCDVCAEFEARNVVLPPLPLHSIADRSLSRPGADLLTLSWKQHIVLVDYYVYYIETSPGIKDTTSTAVLKFIKQQFSRHDILNILVTDNGLQFASREFIELNSTWEFKHVTSLKFTPSIKWESRVSSESSKETLVESIQRRCRSITVTIRLQKKTYSRNTK